MAETKVIDISALKVQDCPYIEWYKFRQCTIKTCRNFTSATSSRCLAIDRVQPIGNKVISDAELHLFKFPDSGVSTRFISIKRKKAVLRVKSILILHAFIDFIKQNYKPDERYWSNKLVERLELEYPLRILKLGYMNWMLPYVTSKKVYEKFAAKKGGECGLFKPNMLLCMTEMKFKALRKSLKTPTTPITTKVAINPQSIQKENYANPTVSTRSNYPDVKKPARIHNLGRSRKIARSVRVGVKQHETKR